MQQTDLASSLIDDFVHSDLTQISVDLAEVGLDTFLNEGIVREIPVIGTVVNVAKAGFAIRDRIFIRKMGIFLLCLQNVTQDEKEAFYQKLKENDHKKKVGETLILLLDRLDDLEKPPLLAKVFEAYVRQFIDFESFKRLSAAIDIAFISDLKTIVDAEKPEQDTERCHNLIRSGLTRIANTGYNFSSDFVSISVVLTELGKLYIDVMKD